MMDSGKWSLLEKGTICYVHTHSQKKKFSLTVEFARKLGK